MNTVELADKIGCIVSDNANIQFVKAAWRSAVKEKIDEEFGEEVPWELCDAFLSIYWKTNVLHLCVSEYNNFTKQD